MLLLVILPQTDTIPPGVPPWLWAALIALGTWGATQLWPFVREQLDAAYKARREARRASSVGNEERFLAAYEQVAKALEGVAASSKEIAAALAIFANHKAADSFVSQQMQRDIADIREHLGLVLPPAPPPSPRRKRTAKAPE